MSRRTGSGRADRRPSIRNLAALSSHAARRPSRARLSDCLVTPDRAATADWLIQSSTRTEPSGAVTASAIMNFASRLGRSRTESGPEEVYLKVQFTVRSNGVESPLTNWERTPYVSFG